MPLTPKEQRKLNQDQKEYKATRDKINSDGYKYDKAKINALERQKKREKEILDLKKKQNDENMEYRDVVQETTSVLRKLTLQEKKLSLSTKKGGDHRLKTLNIMKQTTETAQSMAASGDLTNEQFGEVKDLIGTLNSGMVDLAEITDLVQTLEIHHTEALDDSNHKLAEFYGLQMDIAKVKEGELATQEQIDESLEMANDLTGDFVGKAIEFGKANPFLKGVLALALLKSLLTSIMDIYQETISGIGDEFGGLGVKEFGAELAHAAANAKKLGYEMSDVAEGTRAMTDDFGITFETSIGLTDEVTDMAKAMKTTVGEAGTLMGMFMVMGGLSKEQTVALTKSAEMLAVAEGVAPGTIMAEVAENTEFFAKFAKDGGRNILEAGIQARKLGLSMSTVESTAEGLLDFQTSLQAEMKATAMLGRRVNLQRARELALSGDHAGMMKEITKEIGSQTEWNELNFYQRTALADALSMELSDMNKLVANQAKAAELGDRIEKQSFADLIGPDGLDRMTQFTNNLAALGALMVNSILPAINMILAPFVFLSELFLEFPVLMNILSVAAAGLIGVMGVLAWSAMRLAAGKVMAAMANAGLMTGGITTPFWIAAGIGLVAKMKSMMTSMPTSMAKGGVVTSPTNAIIGEAGPEAVIPLSQMGGMSSKETNDRLDGMKRKADETNKRLVELIDAVSFGLGPDSALARSIGRETVKAGTRLV